MKIEVRLFARARDLAGAPSIQVDLPESATVAELKSELLRTKPQLEPLARSLLVAVGSDYASDAHILASGDDVACFPPVSGG